MAWKPSFSRRALGKETVLRYLSKKISWKARTDLLKKHLRCLSTLSPRDIRDNRHGDLAELQPRLLGEQGIMRAIIIEAFYVDLFLLISLWEHLGYVPIQEVMKLGSRDPKWPAQDFTASSCRARTDSSPDILGDYSINMGFLDLVE